MSPLFDLSGKTALVTGANTGLGQAIALALAEAGAGIVAVGRSAMDETEALVRRTGRPFKSVRADLATLEPIDRVVAEASELGRIDILVNNAGIIRRADAIDFTEADWDAVMDVNLKSVFFLSQAVARRMLADGRGGKIVNVASLLSFQGGRARAVLHGVEERARRADATARLRMGGAGHRCERHRARLFPHQQHPGVAGRPGPLGRDPGAHPGRTLGQAGRARGCGRVPGLGGRRLRPWRGAAGRRRLARPLNVA